MNRRKFIGNAIIYFFATLLVVWTVVPIYWMLNISFMYRTEVLRIPSHFYPHQPTLFNYQRILGFDNIVGLGGKVYGPSGHAELVMRGLKSSVIISVVTVLLTMIIALPVAYAMGRLNFRFKNTLLFAILFSRAYPPIAIVIPFFMLTQRLALRGTYAGMVLVYLSITVPLVVWIMMGFFRSLPQAVEREARLDGCTRFQAFYKVLLPMSWPGVAASAVIAFMFAWNEFVFAFILSAGTPVQTLPATIAGMFFQAFGEPGELTGAAFLGVLPPLVLAYIFQRRIRQLNIVDPL
jgi:ABC-type glycerol-3-phosphate transport system permease component